MFIGTLNKFGRYHSAYKNMRFNGRCDSLKKGIEKKAEKKENYGRKLKFYFFINNFRVRCNRFAGMIAYQNNQVI